MTPRIRPVTSCGAHDPEEFHEEKIIADGSIGRVYRRGRRLGNEIHRISHPSNLAVLPSGSSLTSVHLLRVSFTSANDIYHSPRIHTVFSAPRSRTLDCRPEG